MQHLKRSAETVFKTLGGGFSERIYHNALEVILKRDNIPFESELNIPVMFEGVEIGKVRADLVIDKKLVVELKRGASIKDSHSTQCQMYMKLLNISNGVIINFPTNDDEYVDFQELTETPLCQRCGRDSHIASGCYAKSHIDGYKL
jgi:GxxExxY protein